MCSPELTRGMCCICYEDIADGDHWQDETGQKYDIHRGECAVHAGYVPPQHQANYDRLVANIRNLDGDLKRVAIRDFYRWAESISR